MPQNFLDVLRRIINSKKSVLAGITVLGDLALVWGFDLDTSVAVQVIAAAWNGFGALLVTVQGVLDAKNGSPSDGTAK